MTRPVRVGITLGDATGIGPEITALTLGSAVAPSEVVPVVYGSDAVWARACRWTQVPDLLQRMSSVPSPTPLAPPSLSPLLVCVDDVPVDRLPPGHPTSEAGRLQALQLQRAADDLAAGRIDALCTAPVSKAAIAGSGLPGFEHFAGHTEYLAARLGVDRVVMLLAGERMRVAVATTHVPLASVSQVLRADGIDGLVRTIGILHDGLHRQFGIPRPRIAVLGLNPHAGEGGLLGDEESTLVRPSIDAAQAQGIHTTGPHPADGYFARWMQDPSSVDAILALYHDQGLAPFKLLESATGVNVTLGLSRPRTSPDHGTAYDLAGTGRADPRSMAAAYALAIRLGRRSIAATD